MTVRAKAAIGALGAALIALAAWWLFGSALVIDDSSAPADRRLDRLRGLGYVDFSEDLADSAASGVTTNIAEETYPGYNLYCSRLSFEAFLIDMDGQTVHRWSYPAEDGLWAHAVMLANGDLIVANRDEHVLRLDWDSNLLWKLDIPVHHELSLVDEDSLYTLTHRYEIYRGVRALFDSIVRLSLEGRVLERWYSYDHLEEIKEKFDQTWFLDTILDQRGVLRRLKDSPLLRTTFGKKLRTFHYFHANTVNVLPRTSLAESDPRFTEGNLLVCLRNINQIAVLDRETLEILWVWGEGVLDWPHHPTMLEDGNILVFDNGPQRGYSRLVEVDPVSGTIVWEYVADPPESFLSRTMGSAQRLPNGNTLVCESNRGRALELTREGEIVWEWFNPLIEDGRRAVVYRMTRIDREVVDRLLQPPAPTR